MENLRVATHREHNTSSIIINGYNDDVDAGTTPETVWTGGGLINWPSTAAPVVIVSTSGSDTGTVTIEGLSSTYAPITETITLTGVTPVTTAASFLRINEAYTSTNVGTITGTISSNPILHIAATTGRQCAAVYTVPLGYKAYVRCYTTSVQKAKDARFSLLIREFGSTFKEIHGIESFQNTFHYDFHVPIEMLAKTDIEIRAVDAETNNTRIHASFEVILIRD
jgi:hypothetical protein